MYLHLFWDNSNIWLVGKNVCRKKEPGDESNFRIHFKNLFEEVVNGRTTENTFVGGSLPPDNDALWKYFENMGAIVETQERGMLNNKEVAVDQAIQFKMVDAILDNIGKPKTMVLLTGDGNGYKDSKGFIKYLEKAVNNGWNIEVVSWDEGCNGHLKNYAKENGIYRPLESIYEKVTFIKDGRSVK